MVTEGPVSSSVMATDDEFEADEEQHPAELPSGSEDGADDEDEGEEGGDEDQADGDGQSIEAAGEARVAPPKVLFLFVVCVHVCMCMRVCVCLFL